MKVAASMCLWLCVVSCDFAPLQRLSATGSDDAGIDAVRDASGGRDAMPDAAPLPIPTGHNIVFLTNGLYTGNLGGLAGADAICNTEARAAGLPGAYVAWLSTPSIPAGTRLTGRGWVRRDGLGFVDTLADLKAGKALRPVRLDAFGNDIGHAFAFTATDFEGAYQDAYTGDTCAGWTSASSTLVPGAAGFTDGTGYGWTDHINPTGLLPCSKVAHLYCFGTSLSQPLDPPSDVGWIAFVSQNLWKSGGGITSADSVCAAEASGRGLPGTYKAFLTTQAASAASRFSAVTEPWIRTDNVRLAETPSAFFAARLEAPLNVQVDGTFSLNATHAQLGSIDWTKPGSSDPTDYTCNDWRSSTSTETAELACTDTTIDVFCGFEQCSGSRPLFCLRAE
ncbi:MAG: hypothetical protein H7Z10_06405 [Gemmatimonadaceae bacterium]|nr:hypothetical protein [Acetobacteraceae bacterium]